MGGGGYENLGIALKKIHWSTKKNFKKLQEVLQLIWTHGGSLITESSVNFYSNVQFFLNFDFLFSHFWNNFQTNFTIIPSENIADMFK